MKNTKTATPEKQMTGLFRACFQVENTGHPLQMQLLVDAPQGDLTGFATVVNPDIPIEPPVGQRFKIKGRVAELVNGAHTRISLSFEGTGENESSGSLSASTISGTLQLESWEGPGEGGYKFREAGTGNWVVVPPSPVKAIKC